MKKANTRVEKHVEDFPEALRPWWEAVDPGAKGSYISRLIGGWGDLEAAVMVLRDRRANLALRGDTGVGKSHFAHALAVHLGELDGLGHPWPLVTISGSAGVTEEDLYGSIVPTVTGQLVQVPGPVELVARYGGLLFLDEVNYIPPAVLGALNQLLAREGTFTNTRQAEPDGSGGWRYRVTKRHPRCYIIAAWNEGATYTGTRQLNEAFLNRWVIWDWDYSPEVEAELIASESLIHWAERMRRSHREGLMDRSVSTSMLLRFEAALYQLGWDYAVSELMSAFSAADRPVAQRVWEDGYATEISADYGVVDVHVPVSDDEEFGDEDEEEV